MQKKREEKTFSLTLPAGKLSGPVVKKISVECFSSRCTQLSVVILIKSVHVVNVFNLVDIPGYPLQLGPA